MVCVSAEQEAYASGCAAGCSTASPIHDSRVKIEGVTVGEVTSKPYAVCGREVGAQRRAPRAPGRTPNEIPTEVVVYIGIQF